ncbi:DUF21 domain-containing protein At4g14240-like isoform X2 [Euphorbia lathyris]|uniref:DUF21 domain-containing protein At4g14240-like isoform X2 n=1 Tax=Euphorbia lathyris TaxID=212925 RepID=UPI003313DADC
MDKEKFRLLNPLSSHAFGSLKLWSRSTVLLGSFFFVKWYLIALPIYLDKLFNQNVAIILSVTFVLFFGEVIPQAICSRYGLAVGSNFVWLVRVLMVICYPIAYPIGKGAKGWKKTCKEWV